MKLKSLFPLFLLVIVGLSGCPTLRQTRSSITIDTQSRRDFYVAENYRKRLGKLRLVGNADKDRDALKQYKLAIRKLADRYNKVVVRNHPTWSTASAVRLAELHQSLAVDLRKAPKPTAPPSAPSSSKEVLYLKEVNTIISSQQSKAISKYKAILAKAKQQNLKNRWTCLAQKHLYELQAPAKARTMTCP